VKVFAKTPAAARPALGDLFCVACTYTSSACPWRGGAERIGLGKYEKGYNIRNIVTAQALRTVGIGGKSRKPCVRPSSSTPFLPISTQNMNPLSRRDAFAKEDIKKERKKNINSGFGDKKYRRKKSWGGNRYIGKMRDA
jgi:hypothetical protein